MKQMRLHSVKVAFKQAVNKQELISKNIQVVDECELNYHLTVKGDPDELIKKLSNYPVQDLEISHASLEEIFLEFYQK